MWKYATISLLLTITGTPTWLWTRNGCVQMAEKDALAFIDGTNKHLGGCTYQDRTNGTDTIRWYHCGDGGSFFYFWDEAPCKALHEKYIERLQRGEGTL